MDTRELLDFMTVIEKMKCNTRHSWTSSGRQESVAEHTYRLCMFAWLVKDEFPELDAKKLFKMCLFHDLGEAVTGDIPCFEKNDSHRKTENQAVEKLTKLLPPSHQKEMVQVFAEIEANETDEAKLFHALDKMEALIQHNEADISTWLPLEYDLQMTYGQEQAGVFSYTGELREMVKQDSLRKIAGEGQKQERRNV